jgi:hypothetical protein
VGPAIPKFIAVRPSNGNIGMGATLQFSAAQIYTDGSIAPLSGATWSSSLPAVAGIDPANRVADCVLARDNHLHCYLRVADRVRYPERFLQPIRLSQQRYGRDYFHL